MIRGYFGHPKAGSTWLSGIFLGVCQKLGLKPYYKQLAMSSLDELSDKNFDFIISQNSSYEKLSQIGPYRGVHVIRDPRDICVSSYFSYKNSHPINGWNQLAELRKNLNSKSKDDGMFDIIDFNAAFFKNMEGWNYSDSNILDIKFEDVINDTYAELIKMATFLNLIDHGNHGYLSAFLLNSKWISNRVLNKFITNGSKFRSEKMSEEAFSEILYRLSFQKLSKGRKRGTIDEKSHYRLGVPGDWKNHFNSDHVKYFDQKYPNLIAKLNYQTD